jgi:hypothetical protein
MPSRKIFLYQEFNPSYSLAMIHELTIPVGGNSSCCLVACILTAVSQVDDN